MLEVFSHKIIFVGLAALAFVSYCIYFDQKRRNDPQYRRRVHERRQLELPRNITVPINAEVVEYFLRQVHLGETYLRCNDWDRTVHYFANAIMICADPQILLGKLRTLLPVELYNKIMVRVRLLFTSDNWSKPSSSITDSYISSPDWSMERVDSRSTCIGCCSEDSNQHV